LICGISLMLILPRWKEISWSSFGEVQGVRRTIAKIWTIVTNCILMFVLTQWWPGQDIWSMIPWSPEESFQKSMHVPLVNTCDTVFLEDVNKNQIQVGVHKKSSSKIYFTDGWSIHRWYGFSGQWRDICKVHHLAEGVTVSFGVTQASNNRIIYFKLSPYIGIRTTLIAPSTSSKRKKFYETQHFYML
jgi:hypothetical protein